jgi:hypothetical protein
MPEVELVVAYPALLVVVLVLAALAASILLYRTTLPPVSGIRRVLLSALRGTLLALLLLLLSEPLLRLVFSNERPPAVALLIDNSQSMRLTDGGRMRSRYLDSLLLPRLIRPLAETGTLSAYTFGSALRPLADPGDRPRTYDEEVTDLSGALHDLARERDRTPLDAAILITDGVYTAGRNPAYAAERLGMPLLTLGIGDSSEQRDLVLTRVLANELVYEGVSSPVDVTLRSTGFGGERVRVSLLDGTNELASSELLLNEGTREYAVRLEYLPPAEGSRKLTVAVSTLQGELTAANNEQAFYVRVLRSKLRVVILAGVPTVDATMLQLSLSEDERFSVRLLTARRGGGWYGGSPEGLDSADCLVLVSFPSAAVAPAALEQVRRALLDRTLPVLFITGPSLDATALRTLGDAVPFALDLPSTRERASTVIPEPTEHLHPLVSPGDPEAWRDWVALPPVFTTMSVVSPRQGVAVLATATTGGSGEGQPFLLARRRAGRAAIALLGHGLWRWRLMGQGSPRTADFHARFFATAIVWLTSREEMRPVRIRPSQEFFRQGEAVTFNGEVYDALRQPVDNARVAVTVRQEQQSYQIDLQPVGSGRYTGELYGLTEGEAAFEGSAVLEGATLGSDSGRVTIGGTNVEYQNTRLDPSLLRELAVVSGGRFFLFQDIDSLPSALADLPSYRPHVEIRQESLALWDWPAVLVLLVVLLAVEWTIRKRSGML